MSKRANNGVFSVAAKDRHPVDRHDCVRPSFQLFTGDRFAVRKIPLHVDLTRHNPGIADALQYGFSGLPGMPTCPR
jgi:hypothetical protein